MQSSIIGIIGEYFRIIGDYSKIDEFLEIIGTCY